MAFPHHPGANDELVAQAGSSRRTKVIIAVVALLLVVVVVLHLTGVVGG